MILPEQLLVIAGMRRGLGGAVKPRSVAGMERKGVRTGRGDEARAIAEHNAERAGLYAEVRETGEQGRVAFLEARAQHRDVTDAFAAWADR